MTFTQYIEQEKKRARVANLHQVRAEIDKSWVQEKINNYVERYDGMFSKEDVIKQIQENDIVASMFAKDPSKQNISELAAERVLGVPKQNQSGKKAIRFDDEGNITSVAKGNTKATDFIYNGYYATQKYTMQAGGAQDNQKNDVIDFLRRGSQQHKVAAIVDGDYWDYYRDELKDIFEGNDNVWITSITEILGDINE